MKRLIGQYQEIVSVQLINQRICCGRSSRQLARQLARVKSSNIWAFGMNAKSQQFGDVIVQFKGQDGYPDDMYMYYDVPIKLYQRWNAAPSKGHFFWKYIRNRFKYRKLTGDRRGKLPNAIN